MAQVSISLDAELVVEVMVLAGIGSPQDAVEAVVRDYIARGHRTAAWPSCGGSGVLRCANVGSEVPRGALDTKIEHPF